MLLLGITWFTSAIGVFFPDIQSIVSVLGQILFYYTPVLFDYNSMPNFIKPYIEKNPLYYIVQGYRDSIYYKIPFWEYPKLTLYFWIWVLVFMIIGTFTFKRLKNQFADNL